MNSGPISGTTHIFFPPRFEVVAGQGHANGLASYVFHDPSLHCLAGGKTDRPSTVPRRWRSADERHNRGFLDAVELPLATRARVVAQCGQQTACAVSLCDSRDFSVISAHSLRRPFHRQPGVQVLQRENATPRSSGKRLPAGLHSSQLALIARRQLQRGDALLGLHPMLRSETAPGFKSRPITTGRSEH